MIGPPTPSHAPSPSKMPVDAPSLILAVDPGLYGGLVLFSPSHNRIIHGWTMPTFQTVTRGKSKAHIDCHSLGRLIKSIHEQVKVAVVEDVSAMPGQGVVSMFRFGMSFGAVLGAVGAYNIPIRLVKPAVWKVSLGVPPDKKVAMEMASRLFPDSKSLWPKRKDDGIAEAALLAHYFHKTETSLQKMIKEGKPSIYV